MKVLYIPIAQIMHPWYDDFVTAIGGKYPVELYDPTKPLDKQLEGVEVIVEQGGKMGTGEMVDEARNAGVKSYHWMRRRCINLTGRSVGDAGRKPPLRDKP